MREVKRCKQRGQEGTHRQRGVQAACTVVVAVVRTNMSNGQSVEARRQNSWSREGEEIIEKTNREGGLLWSQRALKAQRAQRVRRAQRMQNAHVGPKATKTESAKGCERAENAKGTQ